jgi:hypothetical protein
VLTVAGALPMAPCLQCYAFVAFVDGDVVIFDGCKGRLSLGAVLPVLMPTWAPLLLLPAASRHCGEPW